jgi:hypothetical protein
VLASAVQAVDYWLAGDTSEREMLRAVDEALEALKQCGQEGLKKVDG